jgi:hypothetical protein
MKTFIRRRRGPIGAFVVLTLLFGAICGQNAGAATTPFQGWINGQRGSVQVGLDAGPVVHLVAHAYIGPQRYEETLTISMLDWAYALVLEGEPNVTPAQVRICPDPTSTRLAPDGSRVVRVASTPTDELKFQSANGNWFVDGFARVKWPLIRYGVEAHDGPCMVFVIT